MGSCEVEGGNIYGEEKIRVSLVPISDNGDLISNWMEGAMEGVKLGRRKCLTLA